MARVGRKAARLSFDVPVLEQAPDDAHSLPAAESSGGLRILFVVTRGALLRFALLIPALAERGHEIHIAFVPSNSWRKSSGIASTELPPRTVTLVEDLCSRFPNVSYGPAARRGDTDGWREVAWMVRALADLAHNANPRYAGADVLRRRTRKRLLRRLAEGGEFEPVGRRLALRMGRRLSGTPDARLSRRVLGIAARLEDAIPTSRGGR